MSQSDVALMAHLLRRAGFGASGDELETYLAQGYEATVEQLLHPETAPVGLEDDDLVRRYHVDENSALELASGQAYWLYRMINTRRPLEEKLTLFWHSVFATGYTKISQPRAILLQVEMFRRYGMGSFRNLLVELSRDPAMIFWLDNKDNHKNGVNENYGRELLELFSMGVGSYTEDDVRQASRAFTGWNIRNSSLHTARSSRNSVWPYGRLDWQFQYREEDHDDDEKVFLGHRGPFKGEEIIDIICREPATARFISRHLYNFFVADEPQVPAWGTVPPRDPAAISALVDAYLDHKYDIRSVLRVLFNSDFFKEATFAKVKSPAGFVAETARVAGTYSLPTTDDMNLALSTSAMGQQLLDPPSVEGWHTGSEWINTSSLVERVNFAVTQLADVDMPGVRSIISRIKASGSSLVPHQLVDTCLDLMGPVNVSEATRRELVGHATTDGELRFGTREEDRSSSERCRSSLPLHWSTSWPNVRGELDDGYGGMLVPRVWRAEMSTDGAYRYSHTVGFYAQIGGTGFNNPTDVALEAWPESGGGCASGYTWGQQV